MQQALDARVLSSSFDGFLTEMEQCVSHAGQLLLFTGERLRLEVMLLRHEKSPQVIWGLRRHEDWAFKATLLRFARSNQAVHLLLVTEGAGAHEIRGWVVSRTMNDFWASALTPEQALQLWERCAASSVTLEPAGYV